MRAQTIRNVHQTLSKITSTNTPIAKDQAGHKTHPNHQAQAPHRSHNAGMERRQRIPSIPDLLVNERS
jgi:hypothetical protein